LQQPALKAWMGKPDNVLVAQQALLHRAQCSGAARNGKYLIEMDEKK